MSLDEINLRLAYAGIGFIRHPKIGVVYKGGIGVKLAYESGNRNQQKSVSGAAQ